MSEYISQKERLQLSTVVERRANGDLIVSHATMGRIEVDEEACTGCKMCVRVCPAKALEMDGLRNVKMVGDFAGCIACGDCIAICKPDAIELTRPMTYQGLYKHIGRGDVKPPRRF